MSKKQRKTGADAQADQPDASRRKFMRSAGLGLGAAGAAAATFGRGGDGEAEAAEPTKIDGKAKAKAGYQETDHVRRYYQLARF
ncbi:MAG: formate dehydrogenase [Rhodovibrio sp.]|nr:formate dehydrogenase [Rhodovibrio sp.]